MAHYVEHQLYDRLFRPKHKIVVFGPGLSPTTDPSTLYLCSRNTHPQGQIILVDSQVGDPLNLREKPGYVRRFDELMALKLESGGEGNAEHHLAEIEAFKHAHPGLSIRVPRIHLASGFNTNLARGFADRALNRGSLYWMLTKRKDPFQGAKDAVAEMLGVLKTNGMGIILNEDEILPDKDVSVKIRAALNHFNVPFSEHEIQSTPFHVGDIPFEPGYRYRKAFVFAKPKGLVLP
ncbi:MAG: hypothetical protein Q8P02_01130 [Candidatus Micrarchaeota archaeon]|nr:hypothetical protein [Candidatus Micrarchaeota archaeon]